MSPPRRPDSLSEAQSEEVRRQGPWAEPGSLLPWDRKLVAHTKRWTKVVAAIAALATAASTVGGVVLKAWRYVRAGGATPPAELPKGTSVASTALDRVDEPKQSVPPHPSRD